MWIKYIETTDAKFFNEEKVCYTLYKKFNMTQRHAFLQ